MSSERPADPLDAVRLACAEVASRARWVRLVEERLADAARALPVDRVRAPAHSPAHHLLGEPEETLAFFVVLDTINFGSGWFPRLAKLPGHSGYFTIAAHLKEWCRREGPPAAGRLVEMTPAACTAIFGQDPRDPEVAELMDHFARALRDLGRLLLDRYGGRPASLVEEAGGSAARLVTLLSALPDFEDVQRLDGRDVPFYKRAQLLASDLSLAMPGHRWGRFEDLDRLTIFADNLVPHVLRVDGLLAYEPSLLQRIEAGELLPRGSREEIEIRALAVHAVERLVEVLAAEGRSATARLIDHHLWDIGHRPRYKARPRHRTRTTAY